MYLWSYKFHFQWPFQLFSFDCSVNTYVCITLHPGVGLRKCSTRSQNSLLFHYSAVSPQLVTFSIVFWLYPPPHSAKPTLSMAQLSCSSSLLSGLSLSSSLLSISQPKLLCLTCKACIILLHPIESISFPTKTNTSPLNPSGCHLNPHVSTTTCPPQMTFALLRLLTR